MEDCDIVHEVVFDPMYRVTQGYTLSASIAAVFPLVHLIFVKIQKTTFNKNIKFLYMLYFTEILISVINSVVVFAHHVVIPFVSVTFCDVLVDPFKLRIFQYLGVFGMSAPMLTNLGITLERLLALIFARYYENSRLHIGVVIGVIVTAADIVIIAFLFHDEHFDKPMMSYFMVPDTSGKGMNFLCSSLLTINVLNLICNYILFKINTVYSTKWRSDLSTRYQMEENILTTQFSTSIAFLHVFFFMLYLVFTLLIRVVGPQFLTSPADLLAIRGIYITIPTYNLIIGFIACSVLTLLQNRKVAKVTAEVAITYSGLEGAQIHDEAILHAWKSANVKMP